MKFTKIIVEAIPVPHFQFFCKNNITRTYLCTWMLTNPKTSTEWGTYSFSHLYTTCIKMGPLQNHEPVIAHPCRHVSCPKKLFWRTSTEWGTCHKPSKGFSLQNQGTHHLFFLVRFYDFQNRWLLHNGEPGMSKHVSRMATWNKENPQKYKGPFCKGWCEKILVSPENHEIYKKCRGNSCCTFPFFCTINMTRINYHI